MAGYLEFDVKGGMKAYVDPSSIRAFLTSPGADAGSIAEPEHPLKIVLASGDEFQTYGTSIAEIMIRIAELKFYIKQHGFDCAISWADGQKSGCGEAQALPKAYEDAGRTPQTL